MPVALPENLARRFGQVLEVYPLFAGISRKVLTSDLSLVIPLVKDVIGIIHVRPPVCRFRGSRINRQSNLPTALEGIVPIDVEIGGAALLALSR